MPHHFAGAVHERASAGSADQGFLRGRRRRPIPILPGEVYQQHEPQVLLGNPSSHYSNDTGFRFCSQVIPELAARLTESILIRWWKEHAKAIETAIKASRKVGAENKVFGAVINSAVSETKSTLRATVKLVEGHESKELSTGTVFTMQATRLPQVLKRLYWCG